MELYLRWTYNGEMQTECFHHDQQVLIGDLDAYWASMRLLIFALSKIIQLLTMNLFLF